MLHLGLVYHPMDQHAASPWVPVGVLVDLGRGGAGLVLCSIRNRVCGEQRRVSGRFRVHMPSLLYVQSEIVRDLGCPVELGAHLGCV